MRLKIERSASRGERAEERQLPASNAACSCSRNSRRNRRERTRTGRKKPGRQAIQRVPSERQAAAGDEAMDVRMVQQVLTPSVQHGDKTDLGAEMTRIGGDRASASRPPPGTGWRRPLALFWNAISAAAAGTVKTTWKYGTGSNSAWRSASHAARASPWHFGQCRLRQEL